MCISTKHIAFGKRIKNQGNEAWKGIMTKYYFITILESPLAKKPLTIPKKLSWCLGWGTYKISQDMVYFIGDRFQGIESFALMSYSQRTAVTIFVVGDDRPSVTGRILREIIGDIELPLTWLGFE